VSNQPTDFEQTVLQMMLSGEISELKILREQLSKAIVSKREFTGHGFFTDFSIPADAPRLQRKARITIADVSVEFPTLKHGAGFVLFIDEGEMSCLEGFCYDETWPDSTDGFALSYLKRLSPGSPNLIPSKERDVEFAFKDFAAEV
jgi:hypothetical protein